MGKRRVGFAELRAWLADADSNLARLVSPRRTDRATGIRTRKFLFGCVLEASETSNGRLHGKSTRFRFNGSKLAELEFRDGVLHGRATAWYRTGKKRHVGEFREGAQTGEWFYFKRDGKLDGVRTGVYENGLRFAAMKGFNDWNA